MFPGIKHGWVEDYSICGVVIDRITRIRTALEGLAQTCCKQVRINRLYPREDETVVNFSVDGKMWVIEMKNDMYDHDFTIRSATVQRKKYTVHQIRLGEFLT